MNFDKTRKRKFDGGGDRERFKKHKWNKNPGQSGANATPLGDRASGAAANSDERPPTSIPQPQPHRQDDRLEKDKHKWSEKEEKNREKNGHTKTREKEAGAAITVTEKFSTPEENQAVDREPKQDKKRKKQLDPADEVESKAERRRAAKKTRSEVERNTPDVGQPTATDHNNEQPEASEDLSGSAANQKKERFICFVGKFSLH